VKGGSKKEGSWEAAMSPFPPHAKKKSKAINPSPSHRSENESNEEGREGVSLYLGSRGSKVKPEMSWEDQPHLSENSGPHLSTEGPKRRKIKGRSKGESKGETEKKKDYPAGSSGF